jgi:hypothetical protein
MRTPPVSESAELTQWSLYIKYSGVSDGLLFVTQASHSVVNDGYLV